MSLEDKAAATRRLWNWIPENRDLHSKKGEQVLALIGKVSNVVHFGSWEQAFKECAVEIRLIEKIARELPEITIAGELHEAHSQG